MTDNELVARMDVLLAELMEHFDALQIIGSVVGDDGRTIRVARGAGNWYARLGGAREFIEMDQAQTTAFELSKVICSEDDDGDELEAWQH